MSQFIKHLQVCVMSALLTVGLTIPISASILLMAEEVYAEDSSSSTKKRVRRTPTMRPEIFKKLDAVRELVESEDFSSAKSKLAAIDKLKRNSYEQAMTWNMHAYLAFNNEDYNGAIKAYTEVLKIKNIPLSLEQNTQYSLTKLYLVQEQYQKALTSLNAWFELVESPSPESHGLKAQIYYQLEQYKEALPEIKKAVALTEKQEKKPRENWLLLERAIYFQNKDYKSMERCLKDLISLYPKANYWIQLSAVYNELGKPDEELAALETAYEQKMLTKEMHYVSLAQAMLAREIPYKAAQILLEGMKAEVVEESARNLSLLGDALMIAKEYDQAIVIMQKAAEKSGEGKDFYKLAQIHTERQEWPEASKSINKALQLGGLRDEHSAYVLQGMILFNQDKLPEAKKAFGKASKFEEAEKIATQWIKFIEGEERRKAYMSAQ